MTYGDIDVVADCGADPTRRAYSDGTFADAVSAARPVLVVPQGAGQRLYGAVGITAGGVQQAPAVPSQRIWSSCSALTCTRTRFSETRGSRLSH